MPFLERITNNKYPITNNKYYRNSIGHWLFLVKREGYSLIELMIVISIFGITISLITASYLTFERNQKFRNGALQLKSDVRFAQNKALSGDKSATACSGDPNSTLIGWYITVSNLVPAKYSIYSDCKTAGVETKDLLTSTLELPKGVTICEVKAGGASLSNQYAYVLFQPLSSSASFYSSVLPTTYPPFADANNVLLPGLSASSLTISFVNQGTVCNTPGTYQVVIQSTGQVNEIRL